MSSCKKYLDFPQDKKQIIPSTLKDCQALLDDYTTMNASYPSDGEGATDNLYLEGATWQILANKEDRDNYIWDAQGKHLVTQWHSPYQVVYNANLVLETLDKIPDDDIQTKKTLRGAALFFRAYAFHQVASLFAAPYVNSTADQLPGIPTRLKTDIVEKSERGTIKSTYDRIISDLKEAASLLPVTGYGLPTRPTKAAAYGALARIYLSMDDYTNAFTMSEECLKLSSTLIDYNDINLNGSAPLRQFNDEVIFHSVTLGGDLFATTTYKVDSTLYNSYSEDDLRKRAFFRRNSDDSKAFKGNYNGRFNAILFNGIATDEIYLIRAECFARAGNTEKAMEDLNTLMKNRWDQNVSYPIITANDPIEALDKVLIERRKELIFRNIRWTDLRRLNKDSRIKKDLTRKLNYGGIEHTYTLPANDRRYTFLIPDNVISTTGMAQNLR